MGKGHLNIKISYANQLAYWRSAVPLPWIFQKLIQEHYLFPNTKSVKKQLAQKV